MKRVLIVIMASIVAAGCTTTEQSVTYLEKDRRDIGRIRGVVASNQEMFFYTSKGCIPRRSVSITVTAPQQLTGYLIIFPDRAEGSEREPQLWSLEKGNKVELDLTQSAVYRRNFHQLELTKIRTLDLKKEANQTPERIPPRRDGSP